MKNVRKNSYFWHVLTLVIVFQTYELQSSQQQNNQSWSYIPSVIAGTYLAAYHATNMYDYYWHADNKKLQSFPTGGDFDTVPTPAELFTFLDKQLVPRSADVNVHIIARAAYGWKQGQLQKYIEIARSLALKNKNSLISMDNLELARRYLIEGQPDKNHWVEYVKNSMKHYFTGYEDLKSSAIHEAGHAVAEVYSDTFFNIYYLTLDSNSRAGYKAMMYSVVQDDPDTEFDTDYFISKMKNSVLVMLAGGIAVQVFGLNKEHSKEMLTDQAAILKLCSHRSMGIDMQNIKRDIANYYPELSKDEQQNIFEALVIEFYPKTYTFIFEHKEQVQKIADLLIEKRNVWGDEIYAALGVTRPLYNFEQANIVSIV